MLAMSVALATQHTDTSEKAGILAALAVSHLVADAIPHGHYYILDKLRQTWPGAVVELGIGGIGLPLLVWYLTTSNLLWLFACVIAASLFDFGIPAGIGFIKRLNHLVHWWDKNHDYPNDSRWRWEIAQTIILIAILILSIFKYG